MDKEPANEVVKEEEKEEEKEEVKEVKGENLGPKNAKPKIKNLKASTNAYTGSSAQRMSTTQNPIACNAKQGGIRFGAKTRPNGPPK